MESTKDALYGKRLADALTESRADFEQCPCYASRAEMLAAVAKRREMLRVSC